MLDTPQTLGAACLAPYRAAAGQRSRQQQRDDDRRDPDQRLSVRQTPHRQACSASAGSLHSSALRCAVLARSVRVLNTHASRRRLVGRSPSGAHCAGLLDSAVTTTPLTPSTTS